MTVTVMFGNPAYSETAHPGSAGRAEPVKGEKTVPPVRPVKFRGHKRD